MQRRQVTIEPFWNRMPRFFLYALTPPALLVLLALAFLNAVLLDFVGQGSGGLLLALGVSLAALIFSVKYGYDILERTAHGFLTPPPLNRETLMEGYELPFKQLAVMIVLMVAFAAIGSVFPPAAIVFAIAAFALLPAIVMTLAIERSMAEALNPATLFRVAFSIGWPYFAVFGLVILLNGGSGTVAALFGRELPVAAHAFVTAFAQNFFWFVNMNLMGYLIFQYHHRVGFEPAALAAQDDGWGEILAPVDEAIDAGDYDAAADRLKAMLSEHPDHAIALRQKRHKVLRLTDRERQLIDNGGTLMAQLIDANRIREATELFIDLTEVDPGLRPGREGDYEPLMQMLVQRGEYHRAVRMANGFHKDFPESTSIPPLYLEVARIFSETLQQPAKARQIAEFLLQRFPEHPVATRARALRDAVTG